MNKPDHKFVEGDEIVCTEKIYQHVLVDRHNNLSYKSRKMFAESFTKGTIVSIAYITWVEHFQNYRVTIENNGKFAPMDIALLYQKDDEMQNVYTVSYIHLDAINEPQRVPINLLSWIVMVDDIKCYESLQLAKESITGSSLQLAEYVQSNWVSYDIENKLFWLACYSRGGHRITFRIDEVEVRAS